VTQDFFSGLSNRELAEAVVRAMHSRGVYGRLFMVPQEGGASVFGSSTPANTVAGLTAGEQLLIFAKVAATAESENPTRLTPDNNDWIN
jgi:hypothetical protein